MVALTGLLRDDAVRAMCREHDEPFLVEGAAERDEGLDSRLDAAARARGLRVTHGGRLHHLTGPVDKADALRALVATWPGGVDGPLVALGDAANDLPMLLAADRPIVMPGPFGRHRPRPRRAALRQRARARAGAGGLERGGARGPPGGAAAAGGRVSVPLEPRVAERVRELGSAEIVVGIPSYNNAGTIGHVVRAVALGLAKHFPGRPAVIVNSDGGSRDGTPEVVAATEVGSPQAILASHPIPPVQRIVTPYFGVPGKGSALRTIFAIAERLQARACAVVDSDLRSITPAWMELLARAAPGARRSTTWRRSTCATSSTARSRTRSSTRSRGRSTGARCASRSAASSASPAASPRTTSASRCGRARSRGSGSTCG